MKKIMVANGTYTKDGQEKTSWKQVGMIGTSQSGKEFVLLDPTVNMAGFQREAGKDMVICSVFEDTPRQQPAQQQSYPQPQQQQVHEIDTGSIPF